MINKEIKIMQFEGKDLLKAMTTNKNKAKNNKDLKLINKKYKATLDYSLEAIKIEEIGKEINDKLEIFTQDDKGNQYSNEIISVSFNYSQKINKNYIVLDQEGIDKENIDIKKKRESIHKDEQYKMNEELRDKLKGLKIQKEIDKNNLIEEETSQELKDCVEEFENENKVLKEECNNKIDELDSKLDKDKIKSLRTKRDEKLKELSKKHTEDRRNIKTTNLEEIKLNEKLNELGKKYKQAITELKENNIDLIVKEEIKDKKLKELTKEHKERLKMLKSTTAGIRCKLYKDGFTIDKVEYVRFMRSSGSSRVGTVLFIRKDLLEPLMEWAYMGLEFKEGDKIDLASLEAYIALPLSSIIDTMQIKSENILIIKDYESTFPTKAMVTKIVKKDGIDILYTGVEDISVTNKIWDGQSLMDSSLFENEAPNSNMHWVKNPKYKDKGMLLLRNRFFKSCCFNSNIQRFFSYNPTVTLEDIKKVKGNYTKATDISQIKLITTASSIKMAKFDDNWKENWLDRVESTFGIVKYEKPSKYFNGQYVKTHYQLFNTIQMEQEEVYNFLKPTFDYLDALNTDIKVMRNHIHQKINQNREINAVNSKDELLIALMQTNDKVRNSDLYHDYKKTITDSYKADLRKGHILTEGTYATLFSNAVEMLQASIGKFDGKSNLEIDEVVCSNFDPNVKMIGCRSPHVAVSNLLLCTNVKNDLITKYFNSTKQIVHINSINNNILERLSSADMDSDSMALIPDKFLVEQVEKNYDRFLVPTSNVDAIPVNRKNTWEEKAKLDINTSINKIGEIINLSQILQSFMWEKMRKGEDITDIFKDVCQLDVMSCIEIDSAKREFTIDNTIELKNIREKHEDILREDGYVRFKNAISYVKKDADNKVILTMGKKKYEELPWSKKKEFEEVEGKAFISETFTSEEYEEYLEMTDAEKLGLTEKQFEKLSEENKAIKLEKSTLTLKNLGVRPVFFKSIAESRGYLFKPMETSMDYLEKAIDNYKMDKGIYRSKNNPKVLLGDLLLDSNLTQIYKENAKESKESEKYKEYKAIVDYVRQFKKDVEKQKLDGIAIYADAKIKDGKVKAQKYNAEKAEFINKLVEKNTFTVEHLKRILWEIHKEEVKRQANKVSLNKLKKQEKTQEIKDSIKKLEEQIKAQDKQKISETLILNVIYEAFPRIFSELLNEKAKNIEILQRGIYGKVKLYNTNYFVKIINKKAEKIEPTAEVKEVMIEESIIEVVA